MSSWQYPAGIVQLVVSSWQWPAGIIQQVVSSWQAMHIQLAGDACSAGKSCDVSSWHAMHVSVYCWLTSDLGVECPAMESTCSYRSSCDACTGRCTVRRRFRYCCDSCTGFSWQDVPRQRVSVSEHCWLISDAGASLISMHVHMSILFSDGLRGGSDDSPLLVTDVCEVGVFTVATLTELVVKNYTISYSLRSESQL